MCAALLASLTSCSGTSGGAAVPTGALPTSSAVAGRTVAITITGSTVTPTPAVIELAAGQTLTLVVTSDHDDQLHAHGFDIEVDLKAGQPTTLALTGKDPGRFDVETHRPALTLLTVAVR